MSPQFLEIALDLLEGPNKGNVKTEEHCFSALEWYFYCTIKGMEEKTFDKGFVDYLEEQMDLKRLCTIKFRSVEGGITTIKAHIIDMSTVSDREMIETDAGIHIGVDQLIQVNDRLAGDYC